MYIYYLTHHERRDIPSLPLQAGAWRFEQFPVLTNFIF
jgi:hypothetical protein